MKTYRGWRDGEGLCHISVHEPFRHNRALEPRRGLLYHAPPDFAWGIGGSGLAQTALALLADALDDDERALRLHQYFKFAVVGTLKRDQEWEMTDAQIIEIVARLEEYFAVGDGKATSATERSARRPRAATGSSRPSKQIGSTRRPRTAGASRASKQVEGTS